MANGISADARRKTDITIRLPPGRAGGASQQPHVIYERRVGWMPLNVGEIWQFRELLYFLTWRDVKVRYKQTVIGALWAILQPFLLIVVFSVIFGRLMNVPSDGKPYPVFAYSALLPWMFFAAAISRSSGSLVSDANLISKVYFPRLIVPAAAVLAALVDFLIAFVILAGMMFYYGIVLDAGVVVLPLFVLLAFATAMGGGLWLSALNVKYRDITHVVPFVTQFLLFLTPVIYPSSIIPERWKLVVALNPMAGVVDGFRWSLLGDADAPGGIIVVSASVAVLLLVTGLIFFRHVEDEFADVV